MNLTPGQVLALKPGEVVSLIGAGGKTSLMYLLSRELARLGPVLITTTTRIYCPGPDQAETVLVEEDLAAARLKVKQAFSRHRIVALGAKLAPDRKLLGIPGEWPGVLARDFPVGCILVEADGSAQKPLKGYAHYEPVIPAASTLVLPLAGISAAGLPLDPAYVHRSDVLGDLLSVSPGATLTCYDVGRAMAHMVILVQQRAPGARIIPWINQADTGSRLADARRAARVLEGLAGSVVLGAAGTDTPVREVWPGAGPAPGVAAVVLAAGTSSRMGKPKMLMPFGGKALIEHTVDHVLGSMASSCIVVLGNEAGRVRAALNGRPVKTVFNPRFGEGQSSSVREGLSALPPDTRGALFCLGDQPLVSFRTMDELITRFQSTGAPVVYPSYQGQRGNPVLFKSSLFPELASLTGDQGGRSLLARYSAAAEVVEVTDPGVVLDMDTPEDVQLLEKVYGDLLP